MEPLEKVTPLYGSDQIAGPGAMDRQYGGFGKLFVAVERINEIIEHICAIEERLDRLERGNPNG